MSRQTVLALMDDICAWLDANDIPHIDVPIDAVPSIANGKITIRAYKRTITGHLQVLAGDTIATEVITVPLLVEPPDVLKPWLAGQVPYRTASDQRRIKAAASRLRETTDG